ncbi:hypothetical protein [Nocardioides flavescens]|uniref:Uncharacterized protein n=1 Tax=Nocardioides flavescens TaxID=2691959 RepID=A0A6L7EVC6_9ACTN|nr:hypothetical protein [Nocardioides flavescens]MXG89398.1 hypothetical protein [Nocardioides flavescens]
MTCKQAQKIVNEFLDEYDENRTYRIRGFRCHSDGPDLSYGFTCLKTSQGKKRIVKWAGD